MNSRSSSIWGLVLLLLSVDLVDSFSISPSSSLLLVNPATPIISRRRRRHHRHASDTITRRHASIQNTNNPEQQQCHNDDSDHNDECYIVESPPPPPTTPLTVGVEQLAVLAVAPEPLLANLSTIDAISDMAISNTEELNVPSTATTAIVEEESNPPPHDIAKDLFLEASPDNLEMISSPTLFEQDNSNTIESVEVVGDAPSLAAATPLQISNATKILPAAAVVGDSAISSSSPTSCSSGDDKVPDNKIQAPSIQQILKFAIPAVGVWLCSPLLSWIDTSAVGLLSGTTQQAALNPATAVTDYAALLIAFLYTGTTNLVAAARGRTAAREESSSSTTTPTTTTIEQTVIGSVQLSWTVGLCFGAVLFGFSEQLIRAMIGRSDPAVVAAATRYVRIRSLGMPAAAMMGTAQSACLGLKDAKSPLYVLLMAAVANFFGDILLVGNSNAWIGGAAGAALATVFSQYVSVVLFAQWLCRPKRKPKTKSISTDQQTAKSQFPENNVLSNTDKAGRSSVVALLPRRTTRSLSWIQQRLARRRGAPKVPEARGFLSGEGSQHQFLNLPSRDIVRSFAEYIVPVTTTQLGRVAGYVTMSHVISSSLGLHAMAAQQVIVSLFYNFCTIADSLSLTAQSFVPGLAEQPPSRQRARALQQTMTNLFRVGSIFSVILIAAVSNMPTIARLSTSDTNVLALVAKVTPYVVGTLSVHCFVTAFEGLLLGRKDLAFVGNMYLAWFFVVPYFLLRVKKAALSGSHAVGLTSVWFIFMVYQLQRCATWSLRALVLQRRTNREADQLHDGSS